MKFILISFVILMSGCFPYYQQNKSKYKGKSDYFYVTYLAEYNISLSQVERPLKATERYGQQIIDTISDDSLYKYYFEDDLLKILWLPTSSGITFLLQNKTDYSIKILWDEAAYVDENGFSHRVIHSGIKYNEKEKPQASSIIVRKGRIEDLIFPASYINFSDDWEAEPLFFNNEIHNVKSETDSLTFSIFQEKVNNNIGKTYQVLLPLQIEDVINDYIFTFKVENIITSIDDGKGNSKGSIKPGPAVK